MIRCQISGIENLWTTRVYPTYRLVISPPSFSGANLISVRGTIYNIEQ